MKRVIVITLIVGACTFALPAPEVLTNDSVWKMVKSGLGEELILSMVQGQPGRYSLTPEELVASKKAGVSE